MGAVGIVSPMPSLIARDTSSRKEGTEGSLEGLCLVGAPEEAKSGPVVERLSPRGHGWAPFGKDLKVFGAKGME